LSNLVQAADLAGGAGSVLIEGNPQGNLKSFFSKSTGNEVAQSTGGGVITHVTQGKAHFLTGAPDVLVEGQPAVRSLDLLTFNHAAKAPGNTPPGPWLSTMRPSLAPSVGRRLAKKGQPRPEETLTIESTVAIDAFTRVAKALDKGSFVVWMILRFGTDIPSSSYEALWADLRAGKLKNPAHKIDQNATLVGHQAGYDAKTKTIWVHRSSVVKALKSNAAAWRLLEILLHELGHYVDDLLRTQYTSPSPELDDAPFEEGTEFAFAILNFDWDQKAEATFAVVRRNGERIPLKVAFKRLHDMMKRLLAADGGREEKRGRWEYFGEGPGWGPHSFGHQSIEDALEPAGFQKEERHWTYFGNWLRDNSQIVDVITYRILGQIPTWLGGPLAVMWSSPQDYVGVRAFLTAYVRRKYLKDYKDESLAKVITPGVLGVYRWEEHIDNPTGREDGQGFDPDLNPSPPSYLLEVDPLTVRKRYFGKSLEYMLRQFNMAANAPRGKGADTSPDTPEPYRHLGAGLHVLEDLFAHSNLVELLLRMVTRRDVFPWTAIDTGSQKYPLVTGTFAFYDTLETLSPNCRESSA